MSDAVLAAVAVTVGVVLLCGPGGRPAAPAPSGRAAVLGGVVLLPLLVIRWPVLAIAGTAGVVGVALWRRRHLRRARHRMRDRVVEACDLIAGELEAGRPPVDVLREAADDWVVLGPVHEAWCVGLPVPEALRRVAATPGAEGLALLAAGWEVSQRAGGGLAEAASAVAADLRAARVTGRLVDGELASARSTASLVAVLPLVAWLMGAGSGGDPTGFLLQTPLGLACLAVGLALELAGLWWIDHLTGTAER